MPNQPISREDVHRLAEACSDAGDAFQSTATRLVKEQRRLSRFVEQQAPAMGPLPGQVALYMLTVSIRVFEQMGGRLGKVSGADLDRATAKVNTHIDALLPADAGFGERAKLVAERAQPNLLDEVLWALYEREDKKDGEVDVEAEKSALVYLTLWVAIEALDANWRPAVA
jgi:hypothetical protein